MITIRKATVDDITSIITIGTKTFLDTYLASTPEEAVRSFAKQVFDKNTLKAEIQSSSVFYHLIYQERILVGYSKIVLNTSNEHINSTQVTKLDRLYVLNEFHGKSIGKKLFDFFVEFSKKHHQLGMRLYVLIENKRAVNIYTKNNFKIVGYHDFVVSETITNPNHVLFLEY